MELARKRVLSWQDYCQFRTSFERHYAAFGKPEAMALLVLDEPGCESVAVACFVPERLSDALDLGPGWARGAVAGDGWELVVGRSDPRDAQGGDLFERDAMNDTLAWAIPA